MLLLFAAVEGSDRVVVDRFRRRWHRFLHYSSVKRSMVFLDHFEQLRSGKFRMCIVLLDTELSLAMMGWVRVKARRYGLKVYSLICTLCDSELVDRSEAMSKALFKRMKSDDVERLVNTKFTA
ncbi:MAG: hypothetical protein HYU39_04065 [Thaumarchaeota archaeon]|nr:hypothetical protein [Nitrososphaerota archaeon]